MERKVYTKHFLMICFLFIGAFIPVLGNSSEEASYPLSEVLDDISERYRVIITYNSKLLSEIEVDFEFLDGEQFESAVNRALASTNLNYKQLTGKYYVVFHKTKTSNKTIKKIRQKFKEIEKLEESENLNIRAINKKQKAEHFIDIIQEAEKLVVEKQLSGTVTDPGGQPLIGATILAKGTSIGTITDVNGAFMLSVPDEVTTLIFSYIGYQSQEIDIQGNTVFNIILQESSSTLDEVVVTGYGTQRKINLTGSVSTVGQNEIDARPITSVATALQGTVSGVFINQNSGQAGRDDVLIRIRGVGTLNNANPLILVDGIEAPLNNINPADIESISVLKDAASSAIYGSRAANGVVLVTTKRGARDQKPTFSYDGYYGISDATLLPEMVSDAVLYAELRNEASTNFGNAPFFSDSQLTGIRANTDIISTDWQDALTRTAPIQQHTFGVSGGSNTTNYRISLGILDQEGIMIRSDFKRINTRLNLDTKVNDQFTFGTSISLTRGDRNGSSENLSALGAGIASAFSELPLFPIYDDQGRFATKNVAFSGNEGFGNPVARAHASNTNVVENAVLANGYVAYEPIEGLTFRATAGVNYLTADNNTFNSKVSQFDWIDGVEFPINAVRSASRSDFERLNTTLWLTGTYEKSIDDHDFSILAGYNQEESEEQFFSAGRNGHLSNAVQVLNAGLASSSVNTGSATEWGLRSYFGRAKYAFQNKYLFEANVRIDGSSRFANDKWGTFPSFSAGWIMSEEAFFKDVSFIDFLKIRASWGQLGNQNVGNFAYSRQLDLSQSYSFGGSVVPGVAQVSLGNPDLSWETATMTNVGLTMFLFDKLDLEVDYFIRNTEDILFNVPISSLSGFSSQIANAASVENKGWELAGLYREKTGEFSFSIGGNVTHVDNTVTELNPNIEAGMPDRFIFGDRGRRIIEQGSPMNSYFGLEQVGVFQSQAEIDGAPDHSGLGSGVGDLRFADVNGDGVINADDRVIIGKENPTWLYGINVSAGWKGFDIAAIFQGAGDFNQIGSEELSYPFFNGAATPIWWVNRWTPENPTNDFPRIFDTSSPSSTLINSWFVFDRSYFRMKNLQIGYTIPGSVLENSFLQGVRFYLNGSNLFTITDLPFGDPERPANADRANWFPNLRVLSGGVSVKF